MCILSRSFLDHVVYVIKIIITVYTQTRVRHRRAPITGTPRHRATAAATATGRRWRWSTWRWTAPRRTKGRIPRSRHCRLHPNGLVLPCHQPPRLSLTKGQTPAPDDKPKLLTLKWKNSRLQRIEVLPEGVRPRRNTRRHQKSCVTLTLSTFCLHGSHW